MASIARGSLAQPTPLVPLIDGRPSLGLHHLRGSWDGLERAPVPRARPRLGRQRRPRRLLRGRRLPRVGAPLCSSRWAQRRCPHGATSRRERRPQPSSPNVRRLTERGLHARGRRGGSGGLEETALASSEGDGRRGGGGRGRGAADAAAVFGPICIRAAAVVLAGAGRRVAGAGGAVHHRAPHFGRGARTGPHLLPWGALCFWTPVWSREGRLALAPVPRPCPSVCVDRALP